MSSLLHTIHVQAAPHHVLHFRYGKAVVALVARWCGGLKASGGAGPDLFVWARLVCFGATPYTKNLSICILEHHLFVCLRIKSENDFFTTFPMERVKKEGGAIAECLPSCSTQYLLLFWCYMRVLE